MIKRGEVRPEIRPLRWMILIMFLFGLAIGVQLLGLLVLPAIAYVVTHQMKEKNSIKLFLITGVVGVLILGFIQNGVIPGTRSEERRVGKECRWWLSRDEKRNRMVEGCSGML